MLDHFGSQLSCQQGLPWSLSGKESSAMQEPQEMRVWILGQEDALEKGMATQSSILAWKIPWTEELGRLQSTVSPKSWTQLKRLSRHAGKLLINVIVMWLKCHHQTPWDIFWPRSVRAAARTKRPLLRSEAVRSQQTFSAKEQGVQAYLVLLYSLYYTSQTSRVFNLQLCGNPIIKQVYWLLFLQLYLLASHLCVTFW